MREEGRERRWSTFDAGCEIVEGEEEEEEEGKTGSG